MKFFFKFVAHNDLNENFETSHFLQTECIRSYSKIQYICKPQHLNLDGQWSWLFHAVES